MGIKTASFILFLALIIAGIIWLQVFLSKKENKWLGLIMPLFCVMISLSAALGLAFFAPVESTEMIFTAIYVFVLFNIPTAILIAIYAGYRKKRNKNSEMEIMKIKDLD